MHGNEICRGTEIRKVQKSQSQQQHELDTVQCDGEPRAAPEKQQFLNGITPTSHAL